MKADLHCHTMLSDGTLGIEEQTTTLWQALSEARLSASALILM